MRKIVILILIIVSAVTSGLVYAARAGKPQFKGVELYSFSAGQDDTIQYALMPGTNAFKQAEYLDDGNR